MNRRSTAADGLGIALWRPDMAINASQQVGDPEASLGADAAPRLPSMPMISSISCHHSLGVRGAGRSILLSTGGTLSPARSRCSSWRHSAPRRPGRRSTTNSAPSQAASDRDTSYEKSTCPGVSMKLSW